MAEIGNKREQKAAPQKGPVHRRTGGRSAKNRDAVLKATLEALTEFGPNGLSFSEIGRRAGVHATSIQRRWGSLENVLLEAVLAYSEKKLPIPDTGSLRDDLVAFFQSLVRYLATPIGETVLRTLASAETEPSLAANRARIIKARYDATVVMAERAAERGELNPKIDPRLAIELAVAPINLRKLSHQPIEDDFVEKVIDALMCGLAAVK